MPTVREFIIDWSSTNSPGGISVINMNADVSAAATQKSALGTFLGAIQSTLHQGTQGTVRSTGRELDAESGALVGQYNAPLAAGVTGTVTGSPLPNASQGLIRLETNEIAFGRFVKGRIFIPGMAQTVLAGGELLSTVQTTYNTALATWVASAAGPSVWSRPQDDRPGLLLDVDTASIWNELAVLRRRR